MKKPPEMQTKNGCNRPGGEGGIGCPQLGAQGFHRMPVAEEEGKSAGGGRRQVTQSEVPPHKTPIE